MAVCRRGGTGRNAGTFFLIDGPRAHFHFHFGRASAEAEPARRWTGAPFGARRAIDGMGLGGVAGERVGRTQEFVISMGGLILYRVRIASDMDWLLTAAAGLPSASWYRWQDAEGRPPVAVSNQCMSKAFASSLRVATRLEGAKEEAVCRKQNTAHFYVAP